MNHNAPQPSFELPAPQPIDGAESDASKSEQAPSRLEQAPQPSQSQPVALQPIQPSQATQPDPSTQTTSTTHPPLIADDADLIEKEWVLKAKQIVSATREDPHTQNREISRFKVDYLKKRYNKDIKLEDA
jgi:hypothetical protein